MAAPNLGRSAVGLPDLYAGELCFALVTEAIGRNGRARIVDAARVRVLESHVDGRHNVFRCVIVHTARARIGAELELTRAELYVVADNAEHAAFADVVRLVWGPHR